jgi:hypothetical protein
LVFIQETGRRRAFSPRNEEIAYLSDENKEIKTVICCGLAPMKQTKHGKEAQANAQHGDVARS